MDFDLLYPKWIVAIITSIIIFGNLGYYLNAANNGHTKPHLYTWLIWGIVSVVVAITQFSSKGSAESIITAIIAFNCFAIAFLAFFKGEKEFTLSDKLCLAGCSLAIAISKTAFALVDFLLLRHHQLGHKALTWH